MSDNLPLPETQILRLKYECANDKYMDFIRELRDKARDKDKLCHGLPILPLETDANPQYIEVNLQDDGMDKGFARIRRYDLRLINYQDPYENLLDVDEFKLYDDDSRLLNVGIEGLLLGFPTFMEAVNHLLDSCKKLTSSQDNIVVRTSLAVLCLVLCEATKIDLLSCMLDNAFNSGFEVPLSSWLLKRINDWGHFSKNLLEIDWHRKTADCNIYLPDDTNAWDDGRRVIGVTCQDLVRFLGIVRAVPAPPDVMIEEEEYEYLSGTCLGEIYTISVYINGGRSGRVYGSIKIDNGYGTFLIYDRDHTETEYVESHGTLSLEDPDGFINAKWQFDMELDLMVMEEGGDNLEISKGKVMWDDFLGIDSYDSRLSALLRGQNGYAVVHYSVFKDAIQAEVEVSLLRKEGHPDASHVCVCGRLAARYGYYTYAADFLDKYYESLLFQKPVSKELSAVPCTLEACKGGERVKIGEAIELSRSRVTVSVDNSLVIVADLKSCEGNKPIVTGSMEWLPKKFGDVEGILEGHPDDSHLLLVKIKWIEIIFGKPRSE